MNTDALVLAPLYSFLAFKEDQDKKESHQTNVIFLPSSLRYEKWCSRFLFTI